MMCCMQSNGRQSTLQELIRASLLDRYLVFGLSSCIVFGSMWSGSILVQHSCSASALLDYLSEKKELFLFMLAWMTMLLATPSQCGMMHSS